MRVYLFTLTTRGSMFSVFYYVIVSINSIVYNILGR